MRPTKIIRRVKRNKVGGGFKWAWITDVGMFDTEELAAIVGVRPQTIHSRACVYGHTSPKLLMKRVPCGRYNGFHSTDEWQALSNEDRRHPDSIKIGKFELDAHDPFDPIKAEKYDKERARMEL